MTAACQSCRRGIIAALDRSGKYESKKVTQLAAQYGIEKAQRDVDALMQGRSLTPAVPSGVTKVSAFKSKSFGYSRASSPQTPARSATGCWSSGNVAATSRNLTQMAIFD
jgi:hypothetical protein